MNNLNLDVNNYNKSKLEQLFTLNENNYDSNIVEQKVTVLKGKVIIKF